MQTFNGMEVDYNFNWLNLFVCRKWQNEIELRIERNARRVFPGEEGCWRAGEGNNTQSIPVEKHSKPIHRQSHRSLKAETDRTKWKQATHSDWLASTLNQLIITVCRPMHTKQTKIKAKHIEMAEQPKTKDEIREKAHALWLWRSGASHRVADSLLRRKATEFSSRKERK